MRNKNEAGVTGMDIVLGIIIFMFSTVVVVSMYYQIYITTADIKIHQYAVGCITDIFEKIDLADYDSVDESKINELINASGMNDYFNEENGSRIETSLKSYKDESNGKQDLIKKINITVIYTIGDKQRTLPISKIKVRE